LTSPANDTIVELQPRQVIFTAGTGNAGLRRMTGLSGDVMHTRPMRMVLARGELHELNGHYLKGNQTQLTVTTEATGDGQQVWQVSGAIADENAKLDGYTLTQRVKAELESALPGLDFSHVEWSTCTVDCAEGVPLDQSQMETIQVLCAGNVTTGWPTKLVLAPLLAQEIANRASSPYEAVEFDTSVFADWPRPNVALLPWDEFNRKWWTIRKDEASRQRRAA
jgi:hypothetical protein